MLRRTALGLLAGNALAVPGLIAGPAKAAQKPAATDPVSYPYPGNQVEFGQSAATPLYVIIPPSGGDDTSVIQDALNQGISVQLLPGNYHINQTLTVGQIVDSTTQLPVSNGTMLAGCGQATQLIPTASFAAMVTLTPGGTVRDLAFYGGNSTVNSTNPNPAVDAISVSMPTIGSNPRQTSPANATSMFINLGGWT